MRSIDNKFYKSKAWEACREAYAKKAGGLCEDCLEKGIYTPGVIVHHKIPLTPERMTDESLMYGFDNLRLLCIECHNKIHFKRKADRYDVDEMGRVTIKA